MLIAIISRHLRCYCCLSPARYVNHPHIPKDQSVWLVAFLSIPPLSASLCFRNHLPLYPCLLVVIVIVLSINLFLGHLCSWSWLCIINNSDVGQFLNKNIHKSIECNDQGERIIIWWRFLFVAYCREILYWVISRQPSIFQWIWKWLLFSTVIYPFQWFDIWLEQFN